MRLAWRKGNGTHISDSKSKNQLSGLLNYSAAKLSFTAATSQSKSNSKTENTSQNPSAKPFLTLSPCTKHNNRSSAKSSTKTNTTSTTAKHKKPSTKLLPPVPPYTEWTEPNTSNKTKNNKRNSSARKYQAHQEPTCSCTISLTK